MSLRLPYIFAVFFMAFASLALSGAHAQETVSSQDAIIKYINASEAKALRIANPDIQVLNVRTNGEFKRGHIDGAIHVNYFSTKFKKKLRALDKTKTYLVHCKSGHRSERAVKVMKKLGFMNIIHLDGGYDAWKKLP